MTAIPAMADVPTLELLSARDLRVKNPIRVLHVLEATLGGTLRYMENIAAATEDTHIVFGLAYGSARADSRLQPLLERARAMGWLTYPIDMRREIGPRNDFSAFVKLRQAIGRFKPHILHCHSSKAGALGRAAASSRLRRPIRLYSPAAIAAPLGAKYLKIEKMLARYTDRFVAVSDSERADIVGWSLAEQSSVDVVYPGSTWDTSSLRHGTTRVSRWALDRAHGSGDGQTYAQKDPTSFVAIIKQLHLQHPNVNAVWLGSGEGERSFRNAVAGLPLRAWFGSFPGNTMFEATLLPLTCFLVLPFSRVLATWLPRRFLWKYRLWQPI